MLKNNSKTILQILLFVLLLFSMSQIQAQSTKFFPAGKCENHKITLARLLKIRAIIYVDKATGKEQCEADAKKLILEVAKSNWSCEEIVKGEGFCVSSKPEPEKETMIYLNDGLKVFINFTNFPNMPLCKGLSKTLLRKRNINTRCDTVIK